MTTEDELAINLINNNIIKSNKMSDKGWFSDHLKWNNNVNCFNNKWSLCSHVIQIQYKHIFLHKFNYFCICFNRFFPQNANPIEFEPSISSYPLEMTSTYMNSRLV